MTLIFTDGACTCNGKPNAKAAFAVVINNHKVIRGLVQPYKYLYNESENKIEITNEKEIISNNRAELLGIIHSFIEIINNKYNDCIVYSDSLICIKTINIWYYSRLKNNTVDQFRNLDLIQIMMLLHKKIKDLGVMLSCCHTRGHQKIKCTDTNTEKIIIEGNNTADLHATLALKDLSYLIYVNI